VATLAVVEILDTEAGLQIASRFCKTVDVVLDAVTQERERIAVARQLKGCAAQGPDCAEPHRQWIRRIGVIRVVKLCVIELRPVFLIADDLACARDNEVIERLRHGGYPLGYMS